MNLIRRILRVAHWVFALVVGGGILLFFAAYWMGKDLGGYETFFKFSPDERWLVASTGYRMRVYDLREGSWQPKDITFHDALGQSYFPDTVAFFDNRTLVMLAKDDSDHHRIIFWDVVEDALRDEFPIDIPVRTWQNMSADGRTMVLRWGMLSSDTSFLAVWDIAGRREVRRVRINGDLSHELQISTDGQVVAMAEGQPRRIYVHAVEGWQLLSDRPKPTLGEFLLAPDGKSVIEFDATSASEIDLQTMSERSPKIESAWGALAIYGFSADGTRLLTTDGEKLSVWDVSDGSVVATADGRGRAYISPHGSFVARFDDPNCHIWNVKTSEVKTIREGYRLDPCSIVCVLIFVCMGWTVVGFVHLFVGRPRDRATLQTDQPVRADIVE